MAREFFIVAFLMAAGTSAGAEPDAAAARHWSLQPRSRPVVPTFRDPQDQAWVRTAVDAFLLARVAQEGLRPSPEADRTTLIRRLYFDLTGLPPTPEEIAHFVNDKSTDAYERLVERLLASPHYGERWGQHWLDVTRFAETDGFEYDRYRPGAWRYRDYVIRSFNEDRPYDRFVREQLAGDENDSAAQENQIAVGFQRLGPIRRNAGNQKVAFSRHEVLNERTDSLGAIFLGLTVGCARCHDHKFDDISQADYYRLQAFLAAAQDHDIVLADAKTVADWKARTEKVEAEIKQLKKELEDKPGTERTALEAKLKEAERRLPPPLPTVSSIRNVEAERTDIHVLKRGNPETKGRLVGMSVPAALLPASTAELPPRTPNPRRALADWLTNPTNPLTARVLVNRVWQYHFGRGIVATANDFGVNGSRPSHPELLDYLANELVAHGWRIKHIHRLILHSNAYRQASTAADHAQKKDPENRLLWRFPRRRLDAEEIRDAMLVAADQLNRKAAGPSVCVPADHDLVNLLYDPAQWSVTEDTREHDRRSIYLLAKRNLRLPFGEVFDAPDLQTSCARRERSTHALQALELLNGSLSNRLADAFARRVKREVGTDPAKQVERSYWLALGRAPSAGEMALARAFLARQPLKEFTLAVFNLNAFVYVD